MCLPFAGMMRMERAQGLASEAIISCRKIGRSSCEITRRYRARMHRAHHIRFRPSRRNRRSKFSACNRRSRYARGARRGGVAAEIVAFRGQRARALAFGDVNGLGAGAPALVAFDQDGRRTTSTLRVSEAWLGRVVDPLGQPIDDLGSLGDGDPRPVRADPPNAARRARLGERISLGVRAMDLFTTCRTGQRLGLFAGSGVGK